MVEMSPFMEQIRSDLKPYQFRLGRKKFIRVPRAKQKTAGILMYFKGFCDGDWDSYGLHGDSR